MPGDVVPARAPRRRVRRLEPVAEPVPVVTPLPTPAADAAPGADDGSAAPRSDRVSAPAAPGPSPLPPPLPPPTAGEAAAMATAESLSRAYTSRAVDTLGTLMEADYKEGTRLAAALALLDRGWGKIGGTPKEEAHDGDDGFDPAAGRERLARELDRLARREGADAPPGPADGS